MTATLTAVPDPHWADEIPDIDTLHEPTVRAIIDTMKRTGAPFAAHVLECQYRHDQIGIEEHAEARRLRDLADFIEVHPDIAFANLGGSEYNKAYVFCNDADHMASVRRTIGGRWTKNVDTNYFNLNGKVGEAFVQLTVSRNIVCERVVVGTETKLVPDPEAPKVEVEQEIVEWVCPDSLLAGVDTPAAPTPVEDAIPF